MAQYITGIWKNGGKKGVIGVMKKKRPKERKKGYLFVLAHCFFPLLSVFVCFGSSCFFLDTPSSITVPFQACLGEALQFFRVV
jgi:hypothetical protein